MTDKKYSASDIKLIKRKEYSIDISMDGFLTNFELAISCAHDFAKTRVTNHLPDTYKYIVCTNASNDIEELEVGEVKYLDDLVQKTFFDARETIKFLWRDKKVPEWINVYVNGVANGYTEIKLVCCGRFSDDKEKMYHANEGKAPFHVLGPEIPIDFDLSSDEKFTLD